MHSKLLAYNNQANIVVAIMRKLLHIILGIIKNDMPFDANIKTNEIHLRKEEILS